MNASDRDRNDPVTNHDEETLVETYLLHLNAVVQGIGTGLFMGLGVFVLTIWLVIKGGEVVGPHLSLLGQYFIGYSVTWGGSFIGLAYGFGLGFCIGYSYAKIYNWVVDKKTSLAKV